MAKLSKSCGNVGHFESAVDSAPPPVTADMRVPGDFKDGVKKAVAQAHADPRELELQGDSRDEARIPGAARSVSELHKQLGEAIAAFTLSEGRAPTAHDSGFWGVFSTLVRGYEKNEWLPRDSQITEDY